MWSLMTLTLEQDSLGGTLVQLFINCNDCGKLTASLCLSFPIHRIEMIKYQFHWVSVRSK